MNTIYWHMNATQGGANLHPGVNLPPGADLHPGANCAHEHGLRLTFCQGQNFQLWDTQINYCLITVLV